MEHFNRTISEGMFGSYNLYKMAVELCPENGIMVELGSWTGESMAFLTVEAINSGKSINLYSVDAFMGNIHSGTVGTGFPQWDKYKQNLQPVWGKFTPIKGLSWDVADQFEDGSVDFVFIDADHTYEGVNKDIDAWLPKMKSGGLFAGHDYDSAKSVKKAVMEFAERTGWEYETGENSWWIIIP